MIENAPPGQGKGPVSHYTDETPDIITPRQTHRQTDLATEEVVADQNTVKSFNGIGGEKASGARQAYNRSFAGRRFKWLQQILSDREQPPLALHVAMVLANKLHSKP